MQDRNTEKLKFEQSAPAISLIIPCYNVPEELIHRALESVRKQSFRDYEIIIVDDGSQEDYQKALQKLCGQTDHIRLIRTENHGVSAARNIGILAARGSHIAFLDADDILAADFMERAWMFLEKTNADAVIGGVVFTHQPCEDVPSERESLPPYSVYGRQRLRALIPHLISKQYRIRFPGGYIGRGAVARLIRTDLVKQCPFDEGVRIGEDILWNYQILSQCDTVCVAEECWYGYWRNPDSASQQYSPAYIEECRKGLDKLAKMIDRKDDQIFLSYMAHLCELLRKIWKNYLRTERTQNRKAYRKAVRKIYNGDPWKEFGGIRYFLSSERITRRRNAVLFRLHLYYEYVAWEERNAQR